MRKLSQNELNQTTGGVINPTTITTAVAVGKAAAKKTKAWVQSGGIQRLVTRMSGS